MHSLVKESRTPVKPWKCASGLTDGWFFVGWWLFILFVQPYISPESTAAAGSVAVAFVLIYIGFFEIGLGGIPWTIGAEMFDESSRASAMST